LKNSDFREEIPGQAWNDGAGAFVAAREIPGQARNDEAGAVSGVASAREERSASLFADYQIIGMIFQTYWLVAQGDSLYLIDRHAAHERILYEDFLRKAQKETVHAQTLLMPIALRLTPRERQTLHDNKEIFARFGFEISNTLDAPEILSVPFLMKGPLPTSFFTELLDKMDDAGFAKDSPYTHKTEIVAMAACKAAIKAGDTQNESEARDLIALLLQLDNPFTCPHGRPTIIEITKNELERRFKR
jgi:DNA mismatch repair protein MutL